MGSKKNRDLRHRGSVKGSLRMVPREHQVYTGAGRRGIQEAEGKAALTAYCRLMSVRQTALVGIWWTGALGRTCHRYVAN